MDNGLFFVSDKLWRSPKYALRKDRSKFTYIGSYRWYPDVFSKKLFEYLVKEYKINEWSFGEYLEVDIDYEEEK